MLKIRKDGDGRSWAKIYAKKGVRLLPKVSLRDRETQEQLLRRFNKTVMKSRVLADVRKKRWYVPKSELNRIERKKAIRRARRMQSKRPEWE